MLLTFFSSALGKNILIGLAFLAAVFAVYEVGHSKGEDDGYKKGIAYQQPTIDKLTNQINAATAAQNNKVQDIQATTANAVVTNETKQAQTAIVRTQIVDHYHTITVPAAATACAVSPPTADAINALLDTQASYDSTEGAAK